VLRIMQKNGAGEDVIFELSRQWENGTVMVMA
jgi:hypothetical protein